MSEKKIIKIVDVAALPDGHTTVKGQNFPDIAFDSRHPYSPWTHKGDEDIEIEWFDYVETIDGWKLRPLGGCPLAKP